MRYENDATKQAIINSAKASLEGLRYKNERGFTFEKFSSSCRKPTMNWPTMVGK